MERQNLYLSAIEAHGGVKIIGNPPRLARPLPAARSDPAPQRSHHPSPARMAVGQSPRARRAGRASVPARRASFAAVHEMACPQGLPIGYRQHWNWQHFHIGNIFTVPLVSRLTPPHPPAKASLKKLFSHVPLRCALGFGKLPPVPPIGGTAPWAGVKVHPKAGKFPPFFMETWQAE